MSLKPAVYGHADDYQASPGELLAAARAQTAEWNARNPESTCVNGYRFLPGTRHRFRAMDADGCPVADRDLLAERLATGADAVPAPSSAVIEFCLVCGAVEWLDDRLRRELEDAAALAAPWELGRAYRLTYELREAPDGSDPGAGEFVYRGLTAAGGRHRFDPVASGTALYLHRGEVTGAR